MNRSYSRIFIAAACLAVSAGAAQAQRGGPGGMPGGGPQGNVGGTVVDSTSGEPLRGATVSLWNRADSTLVTGAIAERDGSFAINGLLPGDYYVKVSYVGRRPRVIGGVTVGAGSGRVDLGPVRLVPDAQLQDEVTVTAEREFMTVGIDRTIYKTDDLTVSAGGNATDVLGNIPQIEVDADGKVSLRGNQNVAVQLNGRPMVLRGDALTSFLRGLPASAIERVEVVTNPSAKYDPEGMGGIINIVLDQQSSRGLSGGVNASGSTNRNYTAGLNLAYGDGPWNIFGSYSFNYFDRLATGNRYRRSSVPGWAPEIRQTSEGDGSYPGHSLNASADYSFGGSTLSLSAITGRWGGGGSTTTASTEKDAAGGVIRRYDRVADDDRTGIPMDYRLGYKMVLEPSSHELSAEIRYSSEKNDITNAYTQSDRSLDGSGGDSLQQRQRSAEHNTVGSYALQADYVRPLWEGSRLETGYKGEVERTEGDFSFETFDAVAGAFQPAPGFGNAYDYRREIHALYGTLGQEFGDFSAQVGLRAEQALTRFDALSSEQSFDNDYVSLFPSAFLNYKASDALQFKASYSRRVQRPWIGALNPTINFQDPTFRQSGNPYLKPEYTDSYELSAVFFTEGATLTLTPFYRYATDIIRRYDVTDSSGISTVTFLNFDTNESYGADLIGTARVGEWLNAFASISGYRTVTDAGNIQDELGSDGFVWMVRGNATFTLMKGLDLQASFFYRAPMNIERGRIAAWSTADFALQQRILGERGRIGLRVSDPFKWMGFSFTRDDEQSYQEFEHTWNSRGVFLTFSYTFGNPSQMPRRDRGGQQPSGGGMDGFGM